MVTRQHCQKVLQCLCVLCNKSQPEVSASKVHPCWLNKSRQTSHHSSLRRLNMLLMAGRTRPGSGARLALRGLLGCHSKPLRSIDSMSCKMLLQVNLHSQKYNECMAPNWPADITMHCPSKIYGVKAQPLGIQSLLSKNLGGPFIHILNKTILGNHQRSILWHS